jgi:hypothetical protein
MALLAVVMVGTLAGGAGDTLDVLARNALGEPVLATPAIVEDKLYVRTKSQLYAFGLADKPSGHSGDNSQSPATPLAP